MMSFLILCCYASLRLSPEEDLDCYSSQKMKSMKGLFMPSAQIYELSFTEMFLSILYEVRTLLFLMSASVSESCHSNGMGGVCQKENMHL